MKCLGTALSICALLLSTPAFAQDPVADNPVWGENIRDTASMLEIWFGDAATAEAIRAQLADGSYYCQADLDANAETFSRFSRWTVIHSSFCETPCNGAFVPGRAFLADREADFLRIFRLARTLFHEGVHMGQSRDLLASLPDRERPAWEATIEAMQVWIDSYEATWDALPRREICDQARHIDRMIGMLRTTIDYIDTYSSKPYARNQAALQATKATLRRRIESLSFRLTQLYLQGANLCPEADAYEEICENFWRWPA